MDWFKFAVAVAVLLAAIAIIGCRYRRAQRGNAMSIWEAVEREDLDAIEAYVRNGGDLDVGAKRPGRTPLLYAMVLNKKKSYTKLLSLGANPNTLNRGGGDIVPLNSSAVFHAAKEKDSFWLKGALEAGGDPNQMNKAEKLCKGTPLYAAIMMSGGWMLEEGIENVKILCEHGADVNGPTDYLGRSPLDVAAGSFEITYYLLEQGADPGGSQPVPERTTFMYYMRRQSPEIYEDFDPHAQKWCAAVLDWLRSHGKDPAKATWNGSKWTWEEE